jgi:anti-sigma B factor antagonist
VLVVRLSGELDLASVPSLEESLRDLDRDGINSLVLDLRPLTFIDSTGIRAILRLDGWSRRDDFQLAVVLPEGAARRPLEVTGVDRWLVTLEKPPNER